MDGRISGLKRVDTEYHDKKLILVQTFVIKR